MNKISKFVGETILECQKHGIGCQFSAQSFIYADGIKCSGYFDEKHLVVAAGKEDWLDVFVHETCHMDQYLKKLKVYRDGDTALHTIEGWLGGDKCSDKKLVQAIRNNILMELDCEKRTVKKIQKYNLDIDTGVYIQQANAYLFSYWATYRDRKWYPFPYNKTDIWGTMPTKFLPTKEYLVPDHKRLYLYK